jgi:chromosome segregation ATPase
LATMTLEKIQNQLDQFKASIEELKTEIDRNKQKEKDLLECNLALLKRLDDANHSTTLYYNDLISIRTHLKWTVKQVLQAEGLENKFKLYEDFCNELALKLPLDPVEE